ncbi:MAG: radical SAM protein [Halanaerobiales bacterium]|nr:radical SAM protein [Halanaerobiales bacterium]
MDESRNLGAFEVKLSGGEITTRDDLAEIVEYARKKYLNVVLITNMSRLSDDLYNCINKYGVSRIEVTLFSLNEDIHDKFVGVKGALNKTLQNISMLKSLGVDILIKIWVIKSNINELDEMIDYFQTERVWF